MCELILERFLHARMLLLRPALSMFCLPDTPSEIPNTDVDEGLHQKMLIQCSILCLRAAHEVIDLAYSNFPKDGSVGLMPAWWYNIFCTFCIKIVRTLD